MNRSQRLTLPLTAIEFEILLSLAREDLHGYAMLQEIEARTGGDLSVRPGTLYRALSRLLEGGLVAERADPADARRRVYHLTAAGVRVARQETARLARQVGTARARLSPSPGGSR
jgi:DNA-binding PadR family transcriptional regulator